MATSIDTLRALHQEGERVELSELERRLLNNYQRGFPLTSTPYADIAHELGISEGLVLQTLQRLRDCGVVTRVGPVFRPARVGVSTLAAMSVPEGEIEEVAEWINGYPEVNHNYEREHTINLWFVVTAPDHAHLERVLEEIEQRCGYPLLDLPLEREFFIDLGFPLWC